MKKKKKLNFKRFLILIILFLFIKNNIPNNLSKKFNKVISKNINNSEYMTIKEDYNKNYPGIGQKKINNQDGYFTTFTTIKNNQKTYFEYKQNGNSSWRNNKYWGGTMCDNGHVNYIKWL